MKKTIFIAALAATVLASCAKNEVFQKETAQTPVTFGVYAGKAATKAVSVTDPYGDIATATLRSSTSGFGVFGYYTGNNPYASGSYYANFMYNEQVTYDSGTSKWEYSPVKYWPNEHGASATSTDTDKLTFMVYAPWVDIKTLNETSPSTVNDGSDSDATEGIVSMTGNHVEGDAKLSFVVPASSAEQIDLLYGVMRTVSTNVENSNDGAVNGPIKDLTKEKTTGTVNILFKHALAKVTLNILDVVDQVSPTSTIDPASDGTKVFVNSLNILGSSLGTSGKLNLYDGTWSNAAGTGSFAVSPLPTSIYQASAPADGDAYDAITEPGVIETGLEVAAQPKLMFVPSGTITGIEIVYYVCTKDANLYNKISVVENHITKNFDTPITITQGKQHNITVRLGLTSVKLDAEVGDWTSGDYAIDLPVNVAPSLP